MTEFEIPGDGSDVAICGLWGDAAPFHTRDSIMMLIFNVISGVCNTRHWIATCSKRMTCQCGCLGRCTFDSMFRFIVWVATACMTKTYPNVRGDGTPFSESTRIGDKLRALKGKAKQAMRTRGAFLQKRGDWAWYKQLLNLTGWQAEGPLARLCF